MNYYSHHIGDFNSATRHLSILERGVYRELLDLYYESEQPLTSDLPALARRICARSQEERDALRMVLEEFFVASECGYTQKRADEEIQTYRDRCEKASRAGRLSGAARSLKAGSTQNERPFIPSSSDAERSLPSSSTQEQPTNTNNQEPIPITKTKTKRRRDAAPDLVFPESLKSDVFRIEWSKWIAYRTEMKRPLQSQTMHAQIARLAEVGEEAAIAAIKASIANGWRGLFTQNQTQTSKHTNEPSPYATDW